MTQHETPGQGESWTVKGPAPLGHYDAVFAGALKAFRVRQGLTQEAFGGLVGLRQNDVSRLENGVRGLTGLDEFVLLCRVIGATPNALLGFLEGGQPAGDC